MSFLLPIITRIPCINNLDGFLGFGLDSDSIRHMVCWGKFWHVILFVPCDEFNYSRSYSIFHNREDSIWLIWNGLIKKIWEFFQQRISLPKEKKMKWIWFAFIMFGANWYHVRELIYRSLQNHHNRVAISHWFLILDNSFWTCCFILKK